MFGVTKLSYTKEVDELRGKLFPPNDRPNIPILIFSFENPVPTKLLEEWKNNTEKRKNEKGIGEEGREPDKFRLLMEEMCGSAPLTLIYYLLAGKTSTSRCEVTYISDISQLLLEVEQ